MQTSEQISHHRALDLMSEYGVRDLKGVTEALTALRQVPDDGYTIGRARRDLRSLKRFFSR